MELQCLLWLNSPIRERQSLLQLLQVKPVTASVSTDSALCRLPCLFSSHWSFLFPSLSFMMVLMASRQLTWHVVAATKSAGFRLPAFRSRLQTSLYRSAGLPVGLVPEVISPYMISLGIRPSCIRQTWPSQRRHLCESSACILNVFAWSSTWDTVQPGDAQDPPQAAQMERVKSAFLPDVHSPRCKEEC